MATKTLVKGIWYTHSEITVSQLAKIKKDRKGAHELIVKMLADANITPIDDTVIEPTPEKVREAIEGKQINKIQDNEL